MPNTEQLFQELNRLLEHEASTSNYEANDLNINHSEIITILSNEFLSTKFSENDRREIGSLFIMWRFRERLTSVEKRHLHSGLELYYRILNDPDHNTSYASPNRPNNITRPQDCSVDSAYKPQFENLNQLEQQYLLTQFPDVSRTDASEELYEEIISTLCKNYFSDQFNETDRKDIGSLFILWKFRESLTPPELKHLNSYLHFFYDVLRHETRTKSETSLSNEDIHEPQTSLVEIESVESREMEAASEDPKEEAPVSAQEAAYSQVLSLIKDHFMDNQNSENSAPDGDRARSSVGEGSHQTYQSGDDDEAEEDPSSGDDAAEEEEEQIIGKEMIVPRSLRGRHSNPVHEHFYQKITLVKDRVKIQEICKACGDGVSNSVVLLYKHLKKCKMRDENEDAPPTSGSDDLKRKMGEDDEPLSPNSDPLPFAKIVTIHGKKMYSCDSCAFHTSNKRALLNHRLSHRTATFDCGVCSYKTDKRVHFLAHLREHTGEKIYKCDICNLTTLYESVMIKHSKKMHQKRPKLHKCTICSFNSYVESDVQEHMKGHDMNTPFQCVICSAKFTQKDGLIEHLKKHTGEKSKSNLNEDRLGDGSHESNTSEVKEVKSSNHEVLTEKRTYNCDVCSFSSNRETSYLSHLKVHITPRNHSENSLLNYDMDYEPGDQKPIFSNAMSPKASGEFKCEICLKHYSSKYSLAIHMKLHTEGRPFKCNLCPYSAGQKAGLLKHLSRHHPESVSDEANVQLLGLQASSPREITKNYFCEICLKGYSTKYSLASHMKLHTERNFTQGEESPVTQGEEIPVTQGEEILAVQKEETPTEPTQQSNVDMETTASE